ncbi:MAG TPA: 16S rRNA (guanine(966)-N(2))-methyltransferase RsmD [Micromonosporaceae bacterium]
MTRIVAGSRGGRRIDTPAGQRTRPTSDRVREALFSSLESLLDLAGCRFADLYAGSGAIGLEAASRGAAHVLLVEAEPRSAQVIRRNIIALDFSAVCRLSPSRVSAVLAAPPDEPFDIVFADPPYDTTEDEVGDLLDGLVTRSWLAPDAVVVVERSSRSPAPRWPEQITPGRSRRYGETLLWYGLRRAEGATTSADGVTTSG